MNTKILFDRVVIKPDPIEEKTKSGIYLAPVAQSVAVRGTVILAGPGMKDYPTSVKEGDRVQYSKNVGSDFQLKDEKYLIVREGDIWAILDPTEE